MKTRTPSPRRGHLLDFAPTGVGDPGLARWARDGIRNGETMVFVADPAVPDLAALAAVLAANGVDPIPDARCGQLVVVEPELFYGGGYTELISQASARGRRPVRSFGGPRLATTVLTPEQFVSFEDQLATSWRQHGTTSLCRYHQQDLSVVGGLTETLTRHESGWGEQLLHAHRPGPGLLVLAGEADISNAHLLGAMFTEALHGARGQLVVDCAALTFTSIGTWHAAAEAVGRHSDAQIRLTGTSSQIRRILTLLDITVFIADDDQ